MLVIRKEQIQAFIAADDRELERVVLPAAAAAQQNWSEGAGDVDLERMAGTGIERARRHGLRNAEDIAAFVAVMFAVAPRFDEQPEIRQVLADPAFTPAVRFYQIFDRVPEDSWKAAEKFYEDSFWFPDAA